MRPWTLGAIIGSSALLLARLIPYHYLRGLNGIVEIAGWALIVAFFIALYRRQSDAG